MKNYNIYFGTIGKTLGCKYRYTKRFNSIQEARDHVKEAAASFYYQNEGTFGLPSYIQILKESKLLNIPMQDLYEDHINDMCRYYVIPTEKDSIPKKKLKF